MCSTPIDVSITDTIRAMSPEARSLLRRYGDHARACAWRLSIEMKIYTLGSMHPECDCRWLEVLGAACEREGVA